jgi:hypothetical protein
VRVKAVALGARVRLARLVEVQVRRTDPEGPTVGDTTPGTSGPGADPSPDAGRLEPVAGTGTGLQREVARMTDGRRITYYWARPGAQP